MNRNAKIALAVGGFVVVGVGAFFIVKMLKRKKQEEISMDYSSSTSSSGGGSSSSSSSSSSPTSAQVELAKAYRLWANSTDALRKKYGKDSQYDLDATTSNPYNSYFKRSYEAGKSDYEASLSGSSSSSSSSDANVAILPYDPTAEIRQLKDAMDGVGTSVKKIQQVIDRTTKEQRRIIQRTWDSQLSKHGGETLMEWIDGEFHFDWFGSDEQDAIIDAFYGN